MRNLQIALVAALGAGLAGQAAAQAPARTGPQWLRTPTAADLAAVYPRAAADRGVGGQAVIRCGVSVQGQLHDCSVTSETPEGLGFGAAALALAPALLMKPATENGQPIEGQVLAPINFAAQAGSSPAGATGAGAATTTVLSEITWAKAPSAADIKAAIDQKAGAKSAKDTVVLQCGVGKQDGRLSDCKALNPTTAMAPFVEVAQSLTGKFQADPAALARFKTNIKINLVFAFPDLQSDTWTKRTLTHVRWARTPDAAAKAALKGGSAVVDCTLDATGALGQCQAISESPAGAGPAAVQIAQAYAANPWTDEGLPTDGAHIRMPIKADGR